MCGICGCSDSNTVSMTDAAGEQRVLRGPVKYAPHVHVTAEGTTYEHVHAAAAAHDHVHTHADGTTHAHAHEQTHHDHVHTHAPHGDSPRRDDRLVTLETAVLAKNDLAAARNRGWFAGRGVLALNLVSSPGAGKTTLLERTIRDLAGQHDIAVIEGDQMTANDAARIRAAGARAVQINTGSGCHLEADMVADAAATLDLVRGSMLLIENVGNLVCPAMFDLGEHMKIAVTSVTEGEDKPLKYPFMFRAASVVILNKTDLAPHVDFDRDAWRANVGAVNPSIRVLEVSARTGEGMQGWYDLLLTEHRQTRA